MDNNSSAPFVSSYTFASKSDFGMVMSGDTPHIKKTLRTIDPKKVDEGNTIFLVSELIPHFFSDIHPKINNPYILITGRSDLLIDERYLKYADKKIIKWYSVNTTKPSDIFEQLPLGLQNRNWSYDGNPQSDPELISSISEEEHLKTNDILLSFRTHTNPGERKKCHDYFSGKSFVKERKYSENDRRDRTFVSDYFREIKKSKFVLCPWGNGVDCHRNYETWYLGSFPIIKRHKALEMLYDLPAWWVNDWSEVTQDKIDEKYSELNNMIYNRDKLLFDYWWGIVKNNK